MAQHATTRSREAFAGLLLIASALLALAAANSAWAPAYQSLLHLPLGPMSVHGWIADGLMALFFLLVGLEVKREWHEGQLASPAARRLPILAAAAGMAMPAILFLAASGFDPALARGWAIPAATDIAFAIAILALLGDRVPASLKLLLVAIAIIDDAGAVVIIALAYTDSLNGTALAAAAAILAGMALMNRYGVRRLLPYVIGFALLWAAMLASGVHSTIAGVLAALAVPLDRGEGHSPLKRLERRLHSWVMLAVMPLFGFASAGVALGGAGELARPLPLAIIAGLFIGKQLGVFGAIWAAVRCGLADKPGDISWMHVYGAALLCGIGFTMSLFIGALAFPNDPAAVDSAKVGTLAGSLLSALCGWAVLRLASPVVGSPSADAEADELFGADPDDED